MTGRVFFRKLGIDFGRGYPVINISCTNVLALIIFWHKYAVSLAIIR
jgi:hypothetical protein